MLGGCTGTVNLIVCPQYETSATQIERLQNQLKLLEGQNQQSISDHAKDQDEIVRLNSENDRICANNNKLEGEVDKMGQLNKEYEENNKQLKENVNKLEGEVNKMTEENNKLAENNKALEAQVNGLKVNSMIFQFLGYNVLKLI